MKYDKFLLFTVLLFVVTLNVAAAEIWISPVGDDRNEGTKESPKQTVHAALRQAREFRRLNGNPEGGVTITLDKGTYNLTEPIFIRPEDSGIAGSPTTIKGVNETGVVISGGMTLGKWRRGTSDKAILSSVREKVWETDVPDFNGNPINFRQLWINGRKAVKARDVADFKLMSRILANDVENEVLWVPAKSVSKIRNSKTAEMVLHQMWEISFLRIKSIELDGDSAGVRFHAPESRIQFEHPWPRPMISPGKNSSFYLTNSPELLDQPGEWYYDRRKAKLYYYPLPDEDMNNVNAVVPVLESVIKIEGTVDRMVANVHFENLNFNYTTWLRPSEKGHVPLQAGMFMYDAYRLIPKMDRDQGNHQLDNQAWIGRQPAAVEVEGASQLEFKSCSFEHLGACGIDFKFAAQNNKVEGCLFRDIAGNGMQIGMFSPKSFETHLPYNPADEREVCSGQVIQNNYITQVGDEDWGCVGICAGYVNDILIANNEVSYLPYTGISLGWGWTSSKNCMRNNKIIANNIHHYAIHMHDVSGIYTLSAQPNSLITENYVHDIVLSPYAHDSEHWFYLYTDEGSSFIEVKNNWCDAEKFLQNANGPGNVWENNGPHVSSVVKEKAGLKDEFKYLLRK